MNTLSNLHVRALVQFSMTNEARPVEIKLLIKSIQRDVLLEELLSWGYISSSGGSVYSKKNYYTLTAEGEEYLVHNFDYVSDVAEILTKKELIAYMRLVSSFNSELSEDAQVECVEVPITVLEEDLVKIISTYNGDYVPIDYLLEESGLSMDKLRRKLRKLNSTGEIEGVGLTALNKFNLSSEYHAKTYGVLFENDKVRKYFFKASKMSFTDFSLAVTEFCGKYDLEYNADGLIPIYAIRRALSKYLTRSEFNEYLLELQSQDVVQLQGGSLPDSDSDKIADSITTELSGLRCYCKLL